MKRGWLVVVAFGLQVAALKLLLRIMESATLLPSDRAREENVPTADERPTEPALRAEPEDARVDEPPRLRRGGRGTIDWPVGEGAEAADARLVEPPAKLPPFIVAEADPQTQLFRGYSAPGWVTFGVYGDGTLRMVDVDGGRFEGKLSGSSATLRAALATSSFDIDFLAIEGGRRRVHFRGGRHDARSLDLDSIGARIAR